MTTGGASPWMRGGQSSTSGCNTGPSIHNKLCCGLRGGTLLARQRKRGANVHQFLRPEYQFCSCWKGFRRCSSRGLQTLSLKARLLAIFARVLISCPPAEVAILRSSHQTKTLFSSLWTSRAGCTDRRLDMKMMHFPVDELQYGWF